MHGKDKKGGSLKKKVGDLIASVAVSAAKTRITFKGSRREKINGNKKRGGGVTLDCRAR